MGGYTGKYSRSPFSVFDEEKNYLFALMQEGIPVTDDDENDGRISTFTQVRRMAQLLGDYGTPNNAFIVEEGAEHAVDSFTATDTITLEAGEGDVSAQYPAGRKFTISGSTAGTNDGTYTVSSATSATPTVITTVETTITTQGSPSPAISTLNVNSFSLITSQGPANADIELAGRFFMRGIMCLLLHDVDYNNDLSDLARQSIHPRVTNVYYDTVSHTVVEDSAANWVVGELIGRTVTVDGNGPFTITSNTADEFEIATDVTASIANGDHYIFELSTPSAPRTDDVYLNVYVDEYDSTDDPALEKNLGGNAIEAQLRAKVIQTLFVREGGAAFADYVDSNGNQHFVFKLATLARDANNTITQAEITSHTPIVGLNNVTLADVAPLRASAKSPAAATVFVVTGQALSNLGASIVTWAGGDSPTFVNKEANPRIDVVVLEEAGTLAIVKGVAAGSPTVPAFYGVPVVFVAIPAGSGAPTIQTADLTDARTLFTPAPDSDLFLGWMLKREISGDAALSAVTVGEIGCDFTTIAAAIAYVNTLTRSADRQCVIYLFESRNANTWTISSSITIPSWTRFMGMGTPTIEIDNATAQIILSTGSSIENLRFTVTATPTNGKITSSTVDRIAIRNVDIHYAAPASTNDYMIDITDTKLVEIDRVRITLDDNTKSPLGISVVQATLTDYRGVRITSCEVHGNINVVTSPAATGGGNFIRLDSDNQDGPIEVISHCFVELTTGDGFGAAVTARCIQVLGSAAPEAARVGNCNVRVLGQGSVQSVNIIIEGIVCQQGRANNNSVYLVQTPVASTFTSRIQGITAEEATDNTVKVAAHSGVAGTHNVVGIQFEDIAVGNEVELTSSIPNGYARGISTGGIGGTITANHVENFTTQAANIDNSDRCIVVANFLDTGGAVSQTGATNQQVANNTF